MRKISLGNRRYALVSDKDYSWLSQYRWHLLPNKWTNDAGYAYRTRSRKEPPGPLTILMHREILRVREGQQVDHKNCRGLDNRRSNIRICSPSQNTCNRRSKNSRYRGVDWHSPSQSWHARIGFEGVSYSLKYHRTQKAAALAYDRAAIKLHGKFARLNFERKR